MVSGKGKTGSGSEWDCDGGGSVGLNIPLAKNYFTSTK
jgi:hypothetical protein